MKKAMAVIWVFLGCGCGREPVPAPTPTVKPTPTPQAVTIPAITKEVALPKEGRIIYNGVSMTPDWPAKIEAAQLQPTCRRKGKVLNRIRYGDEQGGENRRLPTPPAERKTPCHDCGVLPGQFHVEGCDREQCPACLGQYFSCPCPD